ncbi:MAG: hypothetical protein ABI619_06195 [Betaproteobacteria bacterium]
MNPEEFPEDLLRFIHTSIASIPYLEALLLLRGTPGKSWDVAGVAARLYLPGSEVRELLKFLSDSGMLVEKDGNYRYQPQSEELRSVIDLLARCYSENLVEITKIIHSGTSRKAHIFADAFKWRKD